MNVPDNHSPLYNCVILAKLPFLSWVVAGNYCAQSTE